MQVDGTVSPEDNTEGATRREASRGLRQRLHRSRRAGARVARVTNEQHGHVSTSNPNVRLRSSETAEQRERRSTATVPSEKGFLSLIRTSPSGPRVMHEPLTRAERGSFLAPVRTLVRTQMHRAFVLLVPPLLATFACAAPTKGAPIPELPPAPSLASAAPRTSASAAPPASVLASSLFAPGAPLVGNVVLSPEAKLYPTASAALAAPKPTEPPRFVNPSRVLVYPVLEGPPGAAKIRTEDDSDDCEWWETRAFADPAYAIEAFVPREQLVARLARAVLVEHPDGTGALAAKGALLRVLADGRAELVDEAMAKAIGPLPRERIALATTSTKEETAPVWTRAFTPLACNPNPQSLDDWREDEARRHQAELTNQREAERTRLYQSCLERERNAPPAPPPKPGRRPTTLETLGKVSCAEIYPPGAMGSGLGGLAGLLGRGSGTDAPRCRAIAPEQNRDMASRLDGQPFMKLTSLVESSPGSSTVGPGAGRAYLANIPRTCGTVRVEIPEEAVRWGGGGRGSGGFGSGRDVFYPRTGSVVTWPDGTIAGKVTRSGSVREDALTPASDDRLCRRVARFAEPLCQSKNDLCRSRECRDRH
jgi:hypothetical protein